MKYLDYLTKEELIYELNKLFSEDQLYELILDVLERRWFLLQKEIDSTSDKYETLSNAERGHYPYSAEYESLLNYRDEIIKKLLERSRLSEEVRYMKKHRLLNPNDNRNYEELKKEENERFQKKIDKELKEIMDEMEKKYG